MTKALIIDDEVCTLNHSHSIIQKYGGNITITNNSEKGATFTVNILRSNKFGIDI